MRSWQRLVAACLTGFFVALLPGQVIPIAAAVVPPTAAIGLEEAATTTATTPSLETDPAAHPDNTLPLPYPADPDGTLKLPPNFPEPGAEPRAPGVPSEADPGEGTHDPGETEVVSWETLLAELDPDAAFRSDLLRKADQLYLAGNRAAAEPLYREAKASKWEAGADIPVRLAPITDPAELPPAAATYWREVNAGIASGLKTRILVPLELLAKNYPEFLPGQALYAQYLLEYDRADEAIAVIEAAIARYPSHPDLLQAQTRVLMAQEKWLEAAIVARQFTVFNPDHPETVAMAELTQANLDRFRRATNQALTGNLLTNILAGVGGYLLTGGLLGPFTAINSTMILLQGESSIGQQVAAQAQRQLPMLEDSAVLDYVNHIGQRLAALTGRDEFTYEFYVVMDPNLNAFALPGGKVFLNAGSLMKTESGAELAGLIGHEISHAVLSHGFQLVIQGNLTNSLAAFIPIPEVAGIAANLIISSYSRDMERQADVLGTQILAKEGYAADGLHNLMITLKAEHGGGGASWFSSHPAPDERLSYLKRLVTEGGYSRYAYEGVEPHLKIRHKVAQLMAAYERDQADEDLSPTGSLPEPEN